MLRLAKLQPVADRVIDQAFSTGFAGLNERDRVFFVLWSYPAAVDNGALPSLATAVLSSSEVPRTTEVHNAAMDELPASTMRIQLVVAVTESYGRFSLGISHPATTFRPPRAEEDLTVVMAT